MLIFSTISFLLYKEIIILDRGGFIALLSQIYNDFHALILAVIACVAVLAY